MATCKEIVEINQFEVVTILANDNILCKNWRLFCRRLKFDQSIMYTLEGMDSGKSSISDIIISIMDHWKSKYPAEANAIKLSQILRDIGCVKSSDDIDALFGTGLSPETQLTMEFQNFYVCSTIQVPQKAAPHPNFNTTEAKLIWFNILSPTIYYTGRDDDMQKIEEQWKKCEKLKRLLFVAITGLGGIGKTELARNYAYQFHKNTKGHSIWIDAETDQTLSQSLQLLATELKTSLVDTSGKEKTQDILITEIYEKLSDEKCLIIFDNLELYENSILSLLITIASKQPPTSRRPFVLVTSRYRPAIKFLGDNCINLELNVLSKESALKFFFKSFGLLDQDSTPFNSVLLIEKLGERLHFYPLAMQQAAAYIKESLFNKSTNDLIKEVANYLDVIEKESRKLLDHRLPQVKVLDDVSQTTFLTWRMTLDKIKRIPEIGGTAIKMMNIISFLSPDNISTEFLMKILERVEVKTVNVAERKSFLQSLSVIFKRCFKSENQRNTNPNTNTKSYEVLRDHSMISISGNKISIHRLVQEVTRIQLNERGKLIDCLDQLLTGIKQMLESGEIPSNQMIHAQIIYRHASVDKVLIEKHDGICDLIFKILYNAGKYRDVYDFSCRILSDLETILEEKGRWKLMTKFWKGRALWELGEYSKSLDVYIETYEKQREIFGVEDDDSLLTANEIGLVHRRMKNYDEALKWYRDTLERVERLKGKEDSLTLALKNNMALVLSDQQKYIEAIELHRDILNVRERVLGKEHPITLITKNNIATVIFLLKDYEDALSMFLEVLEGRERVLDLDHPNTLKTKGWIAQTYGCIGMMDEALQLATEVYEKMNKILGPKHPSTIFTKYIVEKLEKSIAEQSDFGSHFTWY